MRPGHKGERKFPRIQNVGVAPGEYKKVKFLEVLDAIKRAEELHNRVLLESGQAFHISKLVPAKHHKRLLALPLCAYSRRWLYDSGAFTTIICKNAIPMKSEKLYTMYRD